MFVFYFYTTFFHFKHNLDKSDFMCGNSLLKSEAIDWQNALLGRPPGQAVQETFPRAKREKANA